MVYDNPAFIGDDANATGQRRNAKSDHQPNDRIPEVYLTLDYNN